MFNSLQRIRITFKNQKKKKKQTNKQNKTKQTNKQQQQQKFKKTKLNCINSKWSFKEYKKIINLKQRCKKNKNKNHQKLREGERQREREETFFFWVRENYAQNGRDSDKFMVRERE